MISHWILLLLVSFYGFVTGIHSNDRVYYSLANYGGGLSLAPGPLAPYD